MAAESYEEHWIPTAHSRAANGRLDDMVAGELFDHTWIAAITQIERHLRLDDGSRVLDAGCGWGRLLLGVKQRHPGVQIDGYELTEEFTERARELVDRYGVSEGTNIVQGDLLEVDLGEERYDSIYSARVLHYIREKDLVLRKLHAALKPGGKAMIAIPNRHNPYQRLAYRHAPLFPIRTMGYLMEAVGFENLRYGGYRMLPSGKRFSQDSAAARIEVALASTPIGRLAGLAYVVGEK